jgi:hypothetical protein
MNAPTCAAPGCDQPVPRRPGPGRPAIYCSPACRPSATTRRQGPITVDIDHDDTTPRGAGWTVTMRRGHRRVTIASDIGRFAATLLRDDLQRLLHPRSQEGARTT